MEHLNGLFSFLLVTFITKCELQCCGQQRSSFRTLKQITWACPATGANSSNTSVFGSIVFLSEPFQWHLADNRPWFRTGITQSLLFQKHTRFVCFPHNNSQSDVRTVGTGLFSAFGTRVSIYEQEAHYILKGTSGALLSSWC